LPATAIDKRKLSVISAALTERPDDLEAANAGIDKENMEDKGQVDDSKNV